MNGDVLLVGAGGRVLRVAQEGAEVHYEHPSRSTFSSALEDARGQIWLVGMDGLARLRDAVAVDKEKQQ